MKYLIQDGIFVWNIGSERCRSNFGGTQVWCPTLYIEYKKIGQKCQRVFLQGWKCTYSGIYVLYENYIPVEFQKFQLKNFQEPKIINFKLPCEILLTLTLIWNSTWIG